MRLNNLLIEDLPDAVMITSGNCVLLCRLMLAGSLVRSRKVTLQSCSHALKFRSLLKQASKGSLSHSANHFNLKHSQIQTGSTVRRCLSQSMSSSGDPEPLAAPPNVIAAVAQMTACGDPDKNYSICQGLAQVL